MNGQEPLCGWEFYRWSEKHFTQADFDKLGLEVSIDGRSLPLVTAGNDKARRKEIMSVVKDYRKG